MNPNNTIEPQEAATIARDLVSQGMNFKRVGKKLAKAGYISQKTKKGLSAGGVHNLIRRNPASGVGVIQAMPRKRILNPLTQRIGALPPLQRIQGVLHMPATDEMKLLMIQGVIAGERANGAGA